VTPSSEGGDTRLKLIFLLLNLERTLDKWEDGSGEETTVKVFPSQSAMTKKVVSFQKIG